jgi:hypothetical protein
MRNSINDTKLKKQMEYNREKAEIETLENHKGFYVNTIRKIVEGDFVLSSANPLNHITSLQNKIEVYVKTEERLNNGHRFQHLLDAKKADDRLTAIFNDLVDSGLLFKQNK